MAVRLAIQWGVFDALGDVGAPEKTSTQLAENAGADPRLVGRLIHVISSLVEEIFSTNYTVTCDKSDLIESTFPSPSRSKRYCS
jgi:hypothetical protein